MAVKTITGAPSARADNWKSIDWQLVERRVKRLQMRIAKAAKEKRHGKAKSLQWLLTHSYDAKLMAIKRVTGNRGGKTAGVDNIVWTTPKQKMQAVKALNRRGYRAQPLRRIYIPKKNHQQRPLDIPTLKCRAMQALYLLALEPIAELKADKNAYGFRQERCCADAIEQCFRALAKKSSAQWILEGDIKSWFNKISHDWLQSNIPMDKKMLNQWLKSGYEYKHELYVTEEGIAQGSIISPTWLNMTLSGLEEAVKSVVPKRSKVNITIYADDFIITGNSKEILEATVIPAVTNFLRVRGLELSKEKTRITHINDGFDFLGFNIRKYQGKLLIKPSKNNIKVLE